ncbi:hypothetical protein CesoFtcFv8_015808 [Champsocephalus esox]|uniref:Uncharacterized protein n=1 Tax=Champsocephalus esox TaxID=159716 RepID=A0AAN8GPV1_9TELE|nr:hypothetical protein CesoFtcFv8_015808 [Champsocephalus esox]
MTLDITECGERHGSKERKREVSQQGPEAGERLRCSSIILSTPAMRRTCSAARTHILLSPGAVRATGSQSSSPDQIKCKSIK